MTTQAIILNGGSSSGKTSIVRSLQDLMPEPWLAFSIDDFVDALPARMHSSEAGIQFSADGAVSVGSDFRTLQDAWMAGVAATARAGAKILVDDVFLGTAASQRRWEQVFGDLDVLWVGVRCAGEVAATREGRRGDRVRGMAARQADVVHEGVHYDLEVDTTTTDPAACARTIAARIGRS